MKRNPQDSTLRNVRASHKRDREIRRELLIIKQKVDDLQKSITMLDNRTSGRKR